MSGIKRATEPNPPSSSSSKSRCVHGAGGGGGVGVGGGGGGAHNGGGGLFGMTALGRSSTFWKGRHTSSALRLCADGGASSPALARCGASSSSARASWTKRTFEIEVPPLVQEGVLLEDEEMASMAFYARVFALKVVRYKRCAACAPRRACTSPPPHVPATTTADRAGVSDEGRGH